jgi:amidase
MAATTPKEPWQAIALRKQAERDSKIPSEWRIPTNLKPAAGTNFVQDFPSKSGFFTPHELEITESTASAVVSKIASAEWSSVEVVKALCKRAAVAQQLINCVTEIYFDEAIKRAEELDAYLKKEGKVIGPLHGLPISCACPKSRSRSKLTTKMQFERPIQHQRARLNNRVHLICRKTGNSKFNTC